MPRIPNEYYEAKHYFDLPGNRSGWGAITDGFADFSEVVGCIIDTRHMDERPYAAAHYHVALVNLDEGTARDVTEDVLAEIERRYELEAA